MAHLIVVADMRGYNIAVLISGRGMNLRALIAESEFDHFPGKICCVVSNNAEALGLKIAQDCGILTHVVQKKDYGSTEECDEQIDKILRSHHIDYVCLAGFMRVLGVGIVGKWPSKIFNMHPSLLPAFPGLNTMERALARGAKIVGCTVHLVDEGVDTGLIIAQAAVRVHDSDNAEGLSVRVMEAEQICYSYALMKTLGSADAAIRGKLELAARKGILLS